MDAGSRTCRGVRGATTVEEDGHEAVAEATLELLDALIRTNGCALEDIGAAIFSLPPDLAGLNPAAVARAHGWSAVPLLMVLEHGGDTKVPRCLRVLLLWNTARAQGEVRHVYLRGAKTLRPDLNPTV